MAGDTEYTAAEAPRTNITALRRTTGKSGIPSGSQTPANVAFAPDAVQETFIRAFTDAARARYDGLQPYAGYLFAVGRNVVIDQMRKARSRQRLSRAADDSLTPDAPAYRGEADPATWTARAELRDRFTAFLESLRENERILVVLRFIRDRPRREVSERTGMSAMRVRLAERRLRGQLYDWMVDAGYGYATDLSQVMVLLSMVL